MKRAKSRGPYTITLSRVYWLDTSQLLTAPLTPIFVPGVHKFQTSSPTFFIPVPFFPKFGISHSLSLTLFFLFLHPPPSSIHTLITNLNTLLVLFNLPHFGPFGHHTLQLPLDQHLLQIKMLISPLLLPSFLTDLLLNLSHGPPSPPSTSSIPFLLY